MSAPSIITLSDETVMGKILYQLKISTEKPQLTVKEIISERVALEVDNINNKANEKSSTHTLVTPKKREQILNNKAPILRKINKERQIEIALEAFQKNGFFILIDDLQAESLEQKVTINENLTISFVKLTPLVGG